MIAFHIKRLLLWLALSGLLLLLALVSGQGIFAGALLLLPLLLLLSTLLNLALRRKVTAALQLTPSVRKGQAMDWCLTLTNGSRLPGGLLLARLTVTNGLTGEESRQLLKLAAPPRGEGSCRGSLTSGCCGYVRVALSQLRLCDWLGLFSLPLPIRAAAGCAVLPDTFPMQVSLEIPALGPEDEEEYSPDKTGYDYSETFQLRDYREGDSLKQLHWKLSEKLDKPISRDPSLPVSRSLLVFWDKQAGDCGPEAMDAMAEAAASLCQSLSSQGILFNLAWRDAQGITVTEIHHSNQLVSLIPEMLKYGRAAEGQPLEESYAQGFGFARTLYLAASAQELPPQGLGSVTALLCGAGEEPPCDWVSFQPETVEEELGNLIL